VEGPYPVEEGRGVAIPAHHVFFPQPDPCAIADNLLDKEYSDTTKEKVAIEQKQRDDAAERRKKGIE
jgi:hypothetical protein